MSKLKKIEPKNLVQEIDAKIKEAKDTSEGIKQKHIKRKVQKIEETKAVVEGGFEMKVMRLLTVALAAVLTLAVLPMNSVKGAENNLLINGGGEEGMTGWTDPDGIWEPSLNTTNHEPIEGETFFWPSKKPCAEAMMYQDVDITEYGEGTWMKLTAWLANYNQSPHDQATLQLSYLDAGGNLLNSDASQQRNPEWGQHQIDLQIPAGAVTARVSCLATRFVGQDNDAYFDDIRLVVTDRVVREVIITGDKDKVTEGETVQLSATDGVYSKASDFEWSSSYDEIATVDENGLVTVHKGGEEVWIYAKCIKTGVVGKYYVNSELGNVPEPEPEPKPEPEPEPKPEPEPEPVTDKIEVNALASVELSWAKVRNAKGYMIFELDTEDNEYKRIKTIKKASKTTCRINDLERGETYTFIVRAFRKDGQKTIYLAESEPIIVTLN